jgi:N-acetylneuraminate synthase
MTRTPFRDFSFTPTDTPIVAEIGQAHDGSLGCAHAYIDAVAQRGAAAIKFQTHIAAQESTRQEPWRVKFSQQDETRFDYWQRMEFTPEQWSGLADHARDKGLEFLSSPFSPAAVELLDRLDVPCWKVASGEIYNPEILDAMWATGKPLMFSSGMSSLADLDKVVSQTKARGNKFLIFQCTTSYPCPPEIWGLDAMAQLRARFDCPVGFSDHSGEIYAGLAAATLGADLLELHVTFSKEMFGPDTPASVTLDDLGRLVDGTRKIRTSLAAPYSKDAIAEDSADLRRMFGRSYALRRPLPKGTVLGVQDLTLKKPAGGLGFPDRDQIIGKRLAHDKLSQDLLTWDDFE